LYNMSKNTPKKGRRKNEEGRRKNNFRKS
jgi:hypothetical protein